LRTRGRGSYASIGNGHFVSFVGDVAPAAFPLPPGDRAGR
jgi:hypothetical protein